MRDKKILLLCLPLIMLSLGTSVSSAAKNEPPNVMETDFLALAALLIRDGHPLRALNTLKQVDVEAEELDRGRFYTLKGLAELNLQQEANAKASFQHALENGQDAPILHVYLAQAHYALKEYHSTVAAIDRAGDIVRQYPALYEMQAQSYWLLEERNSAWRVLTDAQHTFSDDHRFLRRKVFYLLELQLYHQAAELGRQYLTQSQAETTDYVAVGNALRLSRQYPEALTILEQGRLLHPTHEALAKVLSPYLPGLRPAPFRRLFDEASGPL